jgi:YNFM family putative membrane transporter
MGSSVIGSLGGVFWNLRGWHGVVSMASALLLIGLVIALWLYRMPAKSAQTAEARIPK